MEEDYEVKEEGIAGDGGETGVLENLRKLCG